MQCGSLIANVYAARHVIESQENKDKNNAAAIGAIFIFLSISIFTSALLIWPIRENRKIRHEEEKKESIPTAYNETLNLLSNAVNLPKDLLKERATAICQSELNLPAILMLIVNNKKEGSIHLNLAELYLSPQENENYTNVLIEFNFDSEKREITLEQFDQRVCQIISKDSQHGSVFSWSWFMAGNIGWQFIYLLTLCSDDWSARDARLDSENWRRTLVTWLCAGLGTSTWLILAMGISQRILSSHYFGGKAFGESYLIALQFIISVTCSDGLWQFFTDFPKAIVNWLGITGKLNIALRILLEIFSYLTESFLFKNIHNLSNCFHDYVNQSSVFQGTQRKWTCTNSFTTLLWLNYCSFNFFAMLTREAMNVFDYSCNPFSVFLISLAGGIGGLILPAILDYAQHVQRTNEAKDCFNQAAKNSYTVDLETVINPFVDNTIDQEPVSPAAFISSKMFLNKNKFSFVELMRHSCMFFNTKLCGFVETVADTYPSPKLFIVSQRR